MTNPNNPAVARAGVEAEKSRLGLSHLCGALDTCCVLEADHYGAHVNCRGRRIGRWITDSRKFGTPPMRPWECACPGSPDLIDARTDRHERCSCARPPFDLLHVLEATPGENESLSRRHLSLAQAYAKAEKRIDELERSLESALNDDRPYAGINASERLPRWADGATPSPHPGRVSLPTREEYIAELFAKPIEELMATVRGAVARREGIVDNTGAEHFATISARDAAWLRERYPSTIDWGAPDPRSKPLRMEED